eukprot:14000_1
MFKQLKKFGKKDKNKNKTKTSHVNKPANTKQTEDKLPNGWRAAYTQDGRKYYQNDITKVTQWNPPKQTATSIPPVASSDPPGTTIPPGTSSDSPGTTSAPPGTNRITSAEIDNLDEKDIDDMLNEVEEEQNNNNNNNGNKDVNWKEIFEQIKVKNISYIKNLITSLVIKM